MAAVGVGDDGDTAGPVAAAEKSEAGASGAAYPEFDKKCIFCRIGNREESVDLLHWDDQFACFRDIRPGAPHHYLVVPRKHIANCKSLKKEHISVVQKMVNIGKSVLQQNGMNDLADIRLSSELLQKYWIGLQAGLSPAPILYNNSLALACIGSSQSDGIYIENGLPS